MRIAEIIAVAAHTRRKPSPANTAAAAPSIKPKPAPKQVPPSSGHTPASKRKPFNQPPKINPFTPNR
jgi:hypothetical protein